MKIKLLAANKHLTAFLANRYCKPISKDMKLKSLIINIALTTVLSLLPPSSGIPNIVYNVVASVALVEYVAKFLDKKD